MPQPEDDYAEFEVEAEDAPDQPEAGAFGTTAAEQLAGESVENRRAQELPDRYAGTRRDREVEQLIEPGTKDVDEFEDVEAELVAIEEPGDETPSRPSAEEAAMHVIEPDEE